MFGEFRVIRLGFLKEYRILFESIESKSISLSLSLFLFILESCSIEGNGTKFISHEQLARGDNSRRMKRSDLSNTRATFNPPRRTCQLPTRRACFLEPTKDTVREGLSTVDTRWVALFGQPILQKGKQVSPRGDDERVCRPGSPPRPSTWLAPFRAETRADGDKEGALPPSSSSSLLPSSLEAAPFRFEG